MGEMKSEKRILIKVINTSLLEMGRIAVERSVAILGGWFHVCWDEGGKLTVLGRQPNRNFWSCSRWGRRVSAGLHQLQCTDEIVPQILGMSKTISNESLLCEPMRLTLNQSTCCCEEERVIHSPIGEELSRMDAVLYESIQESVFLHYNCAHWLLCMQ
ncbi:MAG: hypothetical protein Q7T85_07585 [Nitrosomonas sp.]|nr:hypothetical protein [Nitrosomonas sp.]